MLRSRLPDPLLLIPHSATREKPRGARINLVLLHEVFSVDPLLLVPLARQLRGLRSSVFLCGCADPVFLIPLRAVTPTGTDSSLWVAPPGAAI